MHFSDCHRWEPTPSASSSSHSPNDNQTLVWSWYPHQKLKTRNGQPGPELMSSSLSTHLVSGARSLLSAQLASEGFPVDSSELAVNQGWRQNLFFFSLLFFFLWVYPIGKSFEKRRGAKFVKWLQVGTGHGAPIRNTMRIPSRSGDSVSTAEQSAAASVPKHEKFSAAAAVRCSCRWLNEMKS